MTSAPSVVSMARRFGVARDEGETQDHMMGSEETKSSNYKQQAQKV
jgi:hypothetical protein